jgi:hypothetical protein
VLSVGSTAIGLSQHINSSPQEELGLTGTREYLSRLRISLSSCLRLLTRC